MDISLKAFTFFYIPEQNEKSVMRVWNIPDIEIFCFVFMMHWKHALYQPQSTVCCIVIVCLESQESFMFKITLFN